MQKREKILLFILLIGLLGLGANKLLSLAPNDQSLALQTYNISNLQNILETSSAEEKVEKNILYLEIETTLASTLDARFLSRSSSLRLSMAALKIRSKIAPKTTTVIKMEGITMASEKSLSTNANKTKITFTVTKIPVA